MLYDRIISRDHEPTNAEILRTIGNTTHWLELRQYLASSYEFVPELFNGGKHGWAIRYRKSGKTLCSLIPEKGAFTALIVLGKKEVEKALAITNKLNKNVRQHLEDSEQLHDGRWLWIRVRKQDDVKSIIEALHNRAVVV